MPLDGNNNSNEWLPLLTPYHYHPNSPATARSLSYSLKQSYLYSRSQARFIGTQTYRQYNFTSIANTRTISGTTWIGIAEFRADLPPHANVISFRASFNVLGAEGQRARVRHRLIITDEVGPNTDTGSEVLTDYDVVPPSSNFVLGNGQNVPIWTGYDQGALIESWYTTRVNTLDASALRTCIATVQAYAVDAADSSVAINYKPGSIDCAWYTYG